MWARLFPGGFRLDLMLHLRPSEIAFVLGMYLHISQQPKCLIGYNDSSDIIHDMTEHWNLRLICKKTVFLYLGIFRIRWRLGLSPNQTIISSSNSYFIFQSLPCVQFSFMEGFLGSTVIITCPKNNK